MIAQNQRDDRLAIDLSLVQRLVATQFPQWALLPVRPVEVAGWDNRTFHLGSDLLVRLPSAERYAAQVEKEHRWLPRLAPLLPLPIPAPLALGVPAEGYPWHWSVYRWLEGDPATGERIAELPRFAANLAQFLLALQRIDASQGPPAGLHNFYRGGPLATYDDQTRRTTAALNHAIEAKVVTEVWKTALASTWQRPPVWVHGDVAQGNLLVGGGHLCAVIDFGCCGVGDPACDLAIAWTLLTGESRAAFRDALPLDAETWARGRGWTLWKALLVLARSMTTNLCEAAEARRVIAEVIADHRAET